MFNLALRIWFTAQLVFLAGLGLYSAFCGSLGTEAITIGFIILFIGMACSAPAFLILGWLLKPALKLAGNMPGAMLAAASTAALAALITYTGWWLILSSPDYSSGSFKEGLGFLLSVIGCTTIATLIHYRQFRKRFRPITILSDIKTSAHF